MYDFDSIINRRNTGSLKWDVDERELPMWVADMDFQTAPEIQEEIKQRAAHGVFGYNIIPDDWYEAYQNWWRKRHQFFIEKEWLIFATGVVPILSSTVRKLTTPGENVLILTPVYNIFYNCILNNGRSVLESELLYEAGEYSIDFADLEEKLANPQTTLMFFCNPHNPVGKIWDKKTLETIGALCEKHHVVVISDEIHCDITAPGKEYVPFASVSEACRNNSITCIAPTKAFNLAGLQTAAAFAPNEVLRHRVWRALNTDEVAEPNSFAVSATVAAFAHGEKWLDELRAYLQRNKELVNLFIQQQIPELFVVPSEATYLMWLDCRRIADNTAFLSKQIRKTTGLYLVEGSEYGQAGQSFLRLNVACPRTILEDGLERLRVGITEYQIETSR